MKLRILFLFIFFSYSVFPQIKTDLYIEKYSALAIEQMRQFRIPASIILAQAILESGNGDSYLATEGKNNFGIKCHGWLGEEIYADDDEKNECFRKYRNIQESYVDHSKFLTTQIRYASLFKLRITDYKGWAIGLKKAGYATSPSYSEKLIKLIERYNLQKFDQKLGSDKEVQFYVSHSYGFPFAHGVGLNYMNIDKFFITADISSSYVFSGASIGGGKHLFNKFYLSMYLNGVYHSFTLDKTQNLNIGIQPELVYVLEKKNKIILINTGFMYFKEVIKDKNIIATFSLSFLIN